MTETLTHGYSSESTQLMLSNEYQHGRVYTLKKRCVLVHTTKEASVMEGLRSLVQGPVIAVVLEVSLGVLFCLRY